MRTTFCAMIALCLLTSSALAGTLTPDQWRADLAVLDEAVRTVHKSPFHTVSEDDYSAMVTALHERIPELSDQEIIVEMTSIVAAVNDGHTRLTGWRRDPKWGFEVYPVGLYWFSDGLFVRQADAEYSELVGAKVLKVGEFSAEEAQAMIARVVAADNAQGKLADSPYFLVTPQILRAVGILATDDVTPYQLEKNGRTWSPEVSASFSRPAHARGFVASGSGWVDAADQAAAELPAWRRHPDQTFWFEYFPEQKLLYVQQNQVRNGPTETLESFYGRVWEEFGKRDVATLVLDLRLNGGGNNYLNKPALTTMVRADASAAVNELSRWTDTVFVGEPSGERVNFYGDTRPTELPNSGLIVHASWLWWQNLDPRDTRDALYPDLAADLSFADYASNRDPALEVILRSDDILTIDRTLELIATHGVEPALPQIRAALADPVYRHRNLEDDINQIGYRLLGEDKTDQAVEIFRLNAEEFPDSWNAWDSLGEAVEVQGQPELALEHFQRSLDLNPESPTGLAAVERLRPQAATSAAEH
jgi:tetratricopeptide (TPR) repeat protein